MEISLFAINKLSKIISGDEGETERLTGPKIIDFFNSYGVRDVYDMSNGGMPRKPNSSLSHSRNSYIQHILTTLNGSTKIKNIVEQIANYHTSDKERTVQDINNIIGPDNFKLELVDDKYVIIGAVDESEELEKAVYFGGIQSQILDELSNAKFIIWVAVAWFTDKILFNKLIEKQKEGVNVQVVVIDDDINQKYGVELEQFFETKRISKSQFENIMHNKFCVIDLETVINGSYNWTKKAQYNQENITVDKSKTLAVSFAEQFIKLKIA